MKKQKELTPEHAAELRKRAKEVKAEHRAASDAAKGRRKTTREDVNQAAARIVREATQQH